MFRFFRQLLTLIIISSSLIAIAIAIIYFLLAPKLPNADALKETQLQVPLRIFSAEIN